MVWDGSETGDRQLQWLVQDHLGSTRMVVDRSGSLGGVRRHDFAPFGEELIAGVGIRSDSVGYSVDSVRQKFGSKERDDETKLDYFGARYFASLQGRFTSPDDFLNDTHPTDTSSWNLYTYARNNPLTYVDPDGEEVYSTNLDEREKKQLIEDWKKKTGYKRIYFDKNNKLTIDTAAGFKGGSAAARTELVAAVDSTSKIFNLRSVSGAEAKEVAFADNKGVGTRTDNSTGQRTDIYDTRIDFGDFKQLKGDKDAIKAFSIGLVTLHEFEHGLHEGSLIGADQPRYPNFPGWLEVRFINPIRMELGLAKRYEYAGRKNGDTVETRFIKRDGKFKVLRWQFSVVGGKIVP